MDFEPTFEVESSPLLKKKKYEYTSIASSEQSDDMPARFRSIRNGLRSVRPEVYALILKLKSKL